MRHLLLDIFFTLTCFFLTLKTGKKTRANEKNIKTNVFVKMAQGKKFLDEVLRGFVVVVFFFLTRT
jgi:hypothetical protein